MFKFLSDLAPRVIALSDRFPWAIPVFGFVSGLASFLLVERKQELAQVIAVMILASWCWLLLEKEMHRFIIRWFGFQLPRPLFNYAAQLVHQESLFFVIPFFYVTTAWNTGQAVYSAILAIAAVVSLIDPIYFHWLVPRRRLYFAFHGLTLFAVLVTALPIIFHLPTAESYQWSLLIALLVAISGVVGESGFSLWKQGVLTLVLMLVAGAAGILVRPWVPPATLWLTQVAVTTEVDDQRRLPEGHRNRLTREELANGLYAYTAIHAPRGLSERVYHVWQLNGREVDKVPLAIRGGREEGYRAWSHKVNFPADPVGRWQIRVVTEANQLIGVLRFRVAATAAEARRESAEDEQPAELLPHIKPGEKLLD